MPSSLSRVANTTHLSHCKLMAQPLTLPYVLQSIVSAINQFLQDLMYMMLKLVKIPNNVNVPRSHFNVGLINLFYITRGSLL